MTWKSNNEGIRSSHKFLLASQIFGFCWCVLSPSFTEGKDLGLHSIHLYGASPWWGPAYATSPCSGLTSVSTKEELTDLTLLPPLVPYPKYRGLLSSLLLISVPFEYLPVCIIFIIYIFVNGVKRLLKVG